MNPNKKQKIDEYFPTQFQRARNRMVARFNRDDVPQEAINLIQSFTTYEPVSHEDFETIRFTLRRGERSTNRRLEDRIYRAYLNYVEAFNSNPIPNNRENYVLRFLREWLNSNYEVEDGYYIL
jgi:hypothetical protein